MHFMKGFLVVVGLSLTITFLVFALNFQIFPKIATNVDNDWLQDLQCKHPYSDISIIGVQYTTGGTMWSLYDSSFNTKKSDMLLVSLFDPRCLKENNSFNIDFHYKFAVCTPKIFRPFFQDDFKLVVPTKMYALPYYSEIEEQYSADFSPFYVRDLNFAGHLKIFLRSFLVLFVLYAIIVAVKSFKDKGKACQGDGSADTL